MGKIPEPLGAGVKTEQGSGSDTDTFTGFGVKWRQPGAANDKTVLSALISVLEPAAGLCRGEFSTDHQTGQPGGTVVFLCAVQHILGANLEQSRDQRHTATDDIIKTRQKGGMIGGNFSFVM